MGLGLVAAHRLAGTQSGSMSGLVKGGRGAQVAFLPAEVRISPTESLPVAVNWKGVPFGIERFCPALMAVWTLPLAVVTGQRLPLPEVM